MVYQKIFLPWGARSLNAGAAFWRQPLISCKYSVVNPERALFCSLPGVVLLLNFGEDGIEASGLQIGDELGQLDLGIDVTGPQGAAHAIVDGIDRGQLSGDGLGAEAEAQGDMVDGVVGVLDQHPVLVGVFLVGDRLEHGVTDRPGAGVGAVPAAVDEVDAAIRL